MAAEAGRGSAMRAVVWGSHLGFPLLGLVAILVRPEWDLRWQDNPSHLVLVAGSSAIATAVAVQILREARTHRDARLTLVALSFLATAGYQFLHGVATPMVLVGARSVGFDIATPMGLLLAAVLAVVSVAPSRGLADRVVEHERLLTYGLLASMVAWAIASILEIPPVGSGFSIEAQREFVGLFAAATAPAFIYAAVAYFRLHRRTPSVVSMGLVTAYVLLAETTVTLAMSRTWQASWWLWHILQAAAFWYLGYAVHVQYRREGTVTGLFTGIALDETVRQVREGYDRALEEFVAALRERGSGEARDGNPVATALQSRFNLTERQREVLEQAGSALAADRDQIDRLGALVAIGHEARVIADEDTLVDDALRLVRDAYPSAGIELLRLTDGRLLDSAGAEHDVTPARREVLRPDPQPSIEGGTARVPLSVKDRTVGLLEVAGDHPLAERDVAVLQSLATQLSIAIENARLYQQLDGLFRSYLSPEVATTLIADPSQAALGGAVREVTVLMADLSGFTTFSERTPPAEVVELLNAYFGAIVPAILTEGGTVVQFVGDAIMAVFNAPADQPDHAARAARAGLGLQRVVSPLADARPDAPRFRVGLNTGPALVGNIGAEQMRNFTAIGDTTNTAARIESLAPVGEVAVSATTLAALGPAARTRPLGSIEVKGKRDPVDIAVLEALDAQVDPA